MATLRSKLIRVAHENPELRPHLLPLIHEAGMGDKLKSMWESYRREHPKAKEPPQSLIDKAKETAPKAAPPSNGGDIWKNLGDGLKNQKEEDARGKRKRK